MHIYLLLKRSINQIEPNLFIFNITVKMGISYLEQSIDLINIKT